VEDIVAEKQKWDEPTNVAAKRGAPDAIQRMKEQKAAYQKELEEKDSFKAKASAYGKDFLGMVSATPTDLHGNVPRLKSDIDGLKSKIKKMEGEGYKKGGKVKSASSRADGIAQRGKTRGKML
jgi:hypothetical protein